MTPARHKIGFGVREKSAQQTEEARGQTADILPGLRLRRPAALQQGHSYGHFVGVRATVLEPATWRLLHDKLSGATGLLMVVPGAQLPGRRPSRLLSLILSQCSSRF